MDNFNLKILTRENFTFSGIVFMFYVIQNISVSHTFKSIKNVCLRNSRGSSLSLH